MVIFLLASYCSKAQSLDDSMSAGRDQAINIFLDCAQCDMAYFKTNFTAVNYANDNFDADVHVLVSALPTGGGGEEYNIRLIGKGKYESMVYNISASMPEYYSADETREALLDKIRLGLVPYLLNTPYGEKISLSIDDSPIPETVEDPWKNWVFDISASGSFSSQKYYESYSMSGSLYASKVTEEIKIESANNYGIAESSFSMKDSDTLTTYNIRQQDMYSQNLVVKSLGGHWGIGGYASFGRSWYGNTEFQSSTGPAAEYNLFNYNEVARRECRFLYSISYEYSNYFDLTSYGKLTDKLFRHDLSINFTYYEPWGTISAMARASSYLNDLSAYSAGGTVIAYIRIFKGLSLNLSGSVGYSNNQRSLRQDQGNSMEYITGQWEMEQGFSYSINAGISYRFGSKNNNAVNPRFGY